jgi:hypothetical protein
VRLTRACSPQKQDQSFAPDKLVRCANRNTLFPKWVLAYDGGRAASVRQVEVEKRLVGSELPPESVADDVKAREEPPCLELYLGRREELGNVVQVGCCALDGDGLLRVWRGAVVTGKSRRPAHARLLRAG